MSIAAMPLERLEREITELASHIHAAMCRWLLLVAEFDRREGWGQWGSKSCADWVSWTCGIAPGAAREHVRVARRLSELPLLADAFSKGELSYSKMRALTRAATPENEVDLLMLARHGTAAHVERVVRCYRGAAAEALGQANRVHRDRYLSCEWEDDGSLVIRGRLPTEEGALLMQALDVARGSLGVPAGTPDRADAEPPPSDDADVPAGTPGARGNADALALMAETVLANRAGHVPGGERYQVVVHVDADALADDHDPGRCHLDDGPALAGPTARRLACDASVITITERDGKPLDVGRRTRSIPPAIRRALKSRDRGCRFPGCTQHRFVDAHHIEHWAHGGATKLDNLVLLCRHHHRLLHEGGYQLVRRPHGDVIFRRPDGRAIPAIPRAHPADAGAPVRANAQAGLVIDHETCSPLSAGDRLDYGMAIEGLLARDGLLDAPVGLAEAA